MDLPNSDNSGVGFTNSNLSISTKNTAPFTNLIPKELNNLDLVFAKPQKLRTEFSDTDLKNLDLVFAAKPLELESEFNESNSQNLNSRFDNSTSHLQSQFTKSKQAFINGNNQELHLNNLANNLANKANNHCKNENSDSICEFNLSSKSNNKVELS